MLTALKEKLTKSLDRMQNPKIAVLGDLGLDIYTRGISERLSPEAPVPILLTDFDEQKFGMAANVVENIKALGGTPVPIGVVGNDEKGRNFRTQLNIAEISDELIFTSEDRMTTTKQRFICNNQQMLRVDREMTHPIPSEIEHRIIDHLKNHIQDYNGVIIEDYCKGVITERIAKTAILMCKNNDIPVFVDPNPKTPCSFYNGADYITPNTKEGQSISRKAIKDRLSIAEACHVIAEDLNIPHVILTMGDKGIAAYERATESLEIYPTFAKEVFDVSGAGDTVIATLAMGICCYVPLPYALMLANLAAGIVVGKPGTDVCQKDELLQFLNSSLWQVVEARLQPQL